MNQRTGPNCALDQFCYRIEWIRQLGRFVRKTSDPIDLIKSDQFMHDPKFIFPMKETKKTEEEMQKQYQMGWKKRRRKAEE